jgi:hypothetical protein
VPKHAEHDDDALDQLSTSRRSFIKKMALFGFAVPAVASFALDGVADAATPSLSAGNQSLSLGNQAAPGTPMSLGNQAAPGTPNNPQHPPHHHPHHHPHRRPHHLLPNQ